MSRQLRRSRHGGRSRDDDAADVVAVGTAPTEHGTDGARGHGQPAAEADALQVPGPRVGGAGLGRRRRHRTARLLHLPARLDGQAAVRRHGLGLAGRHGRHGGRLEARPRARGRQEADARHDRGRHLQRPDVGKPRRHLRHHARQGGTDPAVRRGQRQGRASGFVPVRARQHGRPFHPSHPVGRRVHRGAPRREHGHGLIADRRPPTNRAPFLSFFFRPQVVFSCSSRAHAVADLLLALTDWLDSNKRISGAVFST